MPRRASGSLDEPPAIAVHRIVKFLTDKYPEMSPAEALATLSTHDRAVWLSSLNEEEARFMEYQWDFWARPNQRFPKGNWSRWILSGGRGFGKLLCIKTLVPTPTGWTTMENLHVGDVIFDEAGKSCKVLWESNIQIPDEAYRITFSDGTYIDACGDHQWITWTHAERKAFLRSPYEDVNSFPENWPQWRLKRTHNRDVPEIRVTEALKASADGMSARQIERDLGLSRNAFRKHMYAGKYVSKPEPKIEHDSPGPQIRLTKELASTVVYGKRGDLNHCIPQCMPLQIPDAMLPIAPYTLGVWLGDGSRYGGCITQHELDQPYLIKEITNDGFICTKHKDPQTFGVLGLPLKACGLFKTKHVPAVYLRASASQRLALLQGLMDTDGGVEAASTVSFSNGNPQIASAVYELIVSLGMHATREHRGPAANGNLDRFRITFTPTMQVFRLPRKANRLSFTCAQQLKRHHRMIVSVERIKPVPMKCITVDSPNSLYLAGESMVCTHNTRVGSEWVRHKIESGECRHMALIAANAKDLRRVIVEDIRGGGSGLLQICPPWNMPNYSPTKMRLTWINPNYKSFGASCSLYSAEEPSSLRGPAHDGAWCDELCLASGTLIKTSIGDIPIEKIKAGMLVWTRKGLKSVIKAAMTNNTAEVFEMRLSNGQKLIGTGKHPIWINGIGFTELQSLRPGDMLKLWDQNLIVSNKASYGMDDVGGLMADITAIDPVDCFIEPYTLQYTGLYRTAYRSTIRMRISSITKYPTLKRLQRQSTGNGINTVLQYGLKKFAVKLNMSSGREESPIYLHAKTVVKNSLLAAHALNSVRLDAHQPGFTESVEQMIYASTVTGCIAGLCTGENSNTALDHAVQYRSMHADYIQNIENLATARYVDFSSGRRTQEHSIAQENAALYSSVHVTSLRKLKIRMPVYNLEVDGCHEYFANGILTHNCKWDRAEEVWDQLQFGLRIGTNPQTVITTTPRPIPMFMDLLKDTRDKPETSRLTTGSTFDNRANLSEKFIKEILEEYEGTRIGRQELYAHLLTDVEGALWNMDLIDKARLPKNALIPPLKTRVVGVDPQMSFIPKAMTGIVVCGAAAALNGRPVQGYVLADCSMSGSPKDWALAVVDAYNSYECHYVIAERNQGGELIADNIHNVDPSVRVKLIMSTKSKGARAIPVVSRYEQGRIFHLGPFTSLEEEMIGFVPGDEFKKKSPNRLDAAVFALDYLMISGMQAGGGISIRRRI